MNSLIMGGSKMKKSSPRRKHHHKKRSVHHSHKSHNSTALRIKREIGSLRHHNPVADRVVRANDALLGGRLSGGGFFDFLKFKKHKGKGPLRSPRRSPRRSHRRSHRRSSERRSPRL